MNEQPLTYEEERKLKNKNYELKSERNKKQEKNELAKDLLIEKTLATAFVGGGTHLVGWILHHNHKDKMLEQEHIQEIEPQLNEAMETIKTGLHDKYPVLDTTGFTHQNLFDKLKDAFYNCHATVKGSFGNKETIIKDGWQEYYVDYRNYSRGIGESELSSYADQITSMTSDYAHASFAETFVESLPAGILAAALTFGLLMAPVAYRKLRIKSLNKKIEKNEQKLEESQQIKRQIEARKLAEKQSKTAQQEKTL